MNKFAYIVPIYFVALFIALVLTSPHRVEAASPTTAGDPARGKAIFEKRCSACHSLDQNREGPRLAGIYGRKSASVPDFQYSAALKASQIVWDDKTLAQWLADPDAMVPSNKMSFQVIREEERLDLIAFLKTANIGSDQNRDGSTSAPSELQ
jgi:cytochrome c